MNTTANLTINLTGTLAIDTNTLRQLIQQIQQPAEKPTTTHQPPASESSFINETQLLEKLSICRRTLFLWRKSRKIPSVKIGRRVLFHWPSVEAALLRKQQGGIW